MGEIGRELVDRFGHDEKGELLLCLGIMSLAGLTIGGVDQVLDETPKEGTHKSGHLIRWFSLTEKGEVEAARIKRKAMQVSGSNTIEFPNAEVSKDMLDHIYDSLQLRPGVFGVGIDLKKLFEQLKKK